MKDLTNKGKELAFLLRHDTDYDWDETGWRSVIDLVENHGFDFMELKEIVDTDDKGRYEFNEGEFCIRATQGHSIPNIFPDLRLVDTSTAPKILYHGTSSRFEENIDKIGLMKMNRNYVQLSSDIETASAVGKRHGGCLVIYKIDLESMIRDNVKVYVSHNGVYMTNNVDPKYFIEKTVYFK